MTTCIVTNGKSPVDKYWRITQSVTGANPIALSWTAPQWVKLLQITANWEPAVPATSEQLVLWKQSGGTYDVVFRTVDPNVLAIKDWVCVTGFLFEKGEIIRVDYPNTDAQTVGVELYIQEIPQ